VRDLAVHFDCSGRPVETRNNSESSRVKSGANIRRMSVCGPSVLHDDFNDFLAKSRGIGEVRIGVHSFIFRQLVGWVEPFAKPIALVPSMMGIASAFTLRARAVAPPILRAGLR
jgi:hypothetical protein